MTYREVNTLRFNLLLNLFTSTKNETLSLSSGGVFIQLSDFQNSRSRTSVSINQLINQSKVDIESLIKG